MRHRMLIQPTLFALLLLASVPACARTAPPAAASDVYRQTANAFVQVARDVSPSVVSVRTEQHRTSDTDPPESLPFGEALPFGEELFERFFGDRTPQEQPQQLPRGRRGIVGQGSGFVFRSDADNGVTYLLTNRHVVADSDRILVRLQDGREFDARVKGVDPQSDVAVLEIDAGGLPELPLGDSSKLAVGDWALAIGNPFGLRHTLTVGVVSATGRTSLGISDYEDFIQTDAAINPGNSGGPLVGLDGEAFGMNTAIFSQSGGYMGIGFAIPINLARQVADQLIDRGEVVRGHLGVVIQDLTPALADSFGLDQARGVLIAQVVPDSPAARAGLEQGDVVTRYRGRAVTTVGAFRNRVAQTEPGTRAELTVVRGGDERRVDVEIGRLAAGEGVAAADQSGPADSLGLSVQTLTPEIAAEVGAEAGEGVVVTGVAQGSPADRAGIADGSIIVQVDREPIDSARDFARRVERSRDDGRVLLLVRDGEMQHYVVLNWG